MKDVKGPRYASIAMTIINPDLNSPQMVEKEFSILLGRILSGRVHGKNGRISLT
jgi:hypothetical protein